MSDHDKLMPSHANDFTFDGLESPDSPLHGRKYKVSNVNRCKDCGGALMFRHDGWPLHQWECDGCHSRQESK